MRAWLEMPIDITRVGAWTLAGLFYALGIMLGRERPKWSWQYGVELAGLLALTEPMTWWFGVTR
jgi:hypothetical protein